MAELEVFVLELLAVDGLAARAIARGEVAALAHELGDHAVEDGALVGERLAAEAPRGCKPPGGGRGARGGPPGGGG